MLCELIFFAYSYVGESVGGRGGQGFTPDGGIWYQKFSDRGGDIPPSLSGRGLGGGGDVTKFFLALRAKLTCP